MERLMMLLPDGTPSGISVDREKAHAEGILHGTSQIFLYRFIEGKLFILLQKRSKDKDSYPNCWDMSCAGHVPFGMDYLENALKELEEELGITVSADELKPVFLHQTEKKAMFYGKLFHDRQISQVYVLKCEKQAHEFTVQKEEISEVKWFSFEDCMSAIERKDENFCLNKEKFQKVYEFLNNNL